MDNAQIRTQLTVSFLAVYGCSGDGNMVAAYTQVLQDIPIEVLRAAYDKVLLECERRPVPATVYKAAKSLLGQQCGTDVLPWADAWAEIEHQMKEAFIYAKPKFSRPEIYEAVKAYGWVDLCSTPSKDMQIARAQLRDIYREVCSRKESREVNGYILGNNPLLESVKLINKPF